MATHGCTGVPCSICGFGILGRPSWTEKDFESPEPDNQVKMKTKVEDLLDRTYESLYGNSWRYVFGPDVPLERNWQKMMPLLRDGWWDKFGHESEYEDLSLVPPFNLAGLSYTTDEFWRCYDCKRKHPPMQDYCRYCKDNWLGER